jgi:hypothetical protein
MITNARTPTDHEALASYFERRAAENSANAAFHARLGETYNDSHPGWRLAMHCDDIAQYFSKIGDPSRARGAASQTGEGGPMGWGPNLTRLTKCAAGGNPISP